MITIYRRSRLYRSGHEYEVTAVALFEFVETLPLTSYPFSISFACAVTPVYPAASDTVNITPNSFFAKFFIASSSYPLFCSAAIFF